MVGASITVGFAVGDNLTPNDTNSNSDDIAGCTDAYADRMGCHSGGYGQAIARANHTGITVATLGDGSVRTVTNSVTAQNWYIMNSSADGQPINFDQ